jgi:hypothetical protein
MQRLLPALFLLALAASARADEDKMVRAWIEPGRDRWVTSPVRLVVSFDGVEPSTLQHLQPGSVRIELDGRDVTEAFVAIAAGTGGITTEAGGTVVRFAVSLPLLPGEHSVEVSYKSRYGGGPSPWRQSFRVYDPGTVLAELWPGKGRVGPAQIDTGNNQVQAPPVTMTPADLAFVGQASADLVVAWARGGAGMQLGALKILLDNVDVTAKFTLDAEKAVWTGAPLANGKRTLVAQVADHAGNLRVATSTFIVFDQSKRYPWFFAPTDQPHPLAHCHHQLQNYSSGQSASAYFHHGVDIRRPRGTRVLTSAGGNITAFYYYDTQPLYFEVEITDKDGFRWQYHHVDEAQIPAAIKQIAATKGPVGQGVDIGANVAWPSQAYSQYFDHIHLNILAPDGRYMNTLNFLLLTQDTKAPTVPALYIVQQGGTTALNPGGGSGAVVSGKLDFIAQAEDLVGTEPYQLTLKRLTWELKELSGSKTHHVPETDLWSFDFLPGGGNRNLNTWDVFRYRTVDGTTSRISYGDYTRRIFYYALTNRIGTQITEAGHWDSTRQTIDGPLFPNGQYELTARAYDERGNAGSRTITFTMQN